jgi:hypothetical protein
MKTNKIFISALALTCAFATLSSCSSDSSSSLPPIGGYNTADEVGASSLKAYWPMNGNGVESKSSTSPSASVGATFGAGVKGQALTLTAGYLDYPSITALTTTSGSITVSCWAKLSNTKLVAGGVSHISEIFNLSGSTPGNGYIGVLGETHNLTTVDTIQVKGHFETKKDDGTQSGGDAVNMTKMEQWMIDDNANPANLIKHAAFANKIGGQWAHIVYVYDGAAGKNTIWVNGVKISNPVWEVRNNGLPLPLVYASTTHPVIGARSNFVAGLASGDLWNQAMTGGIDEVRVWDKALIQADINALYELEKAGR